MRRLLMTAVIAAVAVTLAGGARADDAADAVREAQAGLMESWNANRVDAALGYFHPDATGYDVGGGVLGTIDPHQFVELVEAGYDVNLLSQPGSVEVLGDVAVVTGYLTGSISVPGAPTMQGTWRASAVWAQHDGRWKLLHWHHSPLVSEVRMVEGGERRREEGEGRDRRVEGGDRREGGEHREGREGGERDRPGAVMLARHQVENFEHWVDVYREHAGMRGEYGSMGSHVYRSADNPNDIVVAVQWRRMEAALAFGASEALRDAMAEGSVVGEPDVWVVNTEHVWPAVDREGVDIGGPSDFSVLVRHKVENLERWVGSFREHSHMRAEAGSLGGFVLAHPHERDDVLVMLGWESIDAAREFVGSPDLAEVMQDAGVVDEPDIVFLTHAFSTDR
jgi:ketosteroid isomerase-like protein/quinol monooxygenase YgiN